MTTLETVVEITIKAKIDMHESFSAYDITTAIRKAVDAGLKFTSSIVTHIGYPYSFYHNDIKAIVHNLAQTMFVNDLKSHFNGTYNEYTPLQSTTPVLAQTTVTATPSDQILWNRIRTYAKSIELKFGSNAVRTLKQLQGSLKGYTIAALLDCLERNSVLLTSFGGTDANSHKFFHVSSVK